MAIEETTLAALEQGRLDAEHTEAKRQARYVAEDAERAALRADEDAAVEGGHAVREAKKAEVLACIDARDAPAAGSREALYAMRIAHLEALVASLVPATSAA